MHSGRVVLKPTPSFTCLAGNRNIVKNVENTNINTMNVETAVGTTTNRPFSRHWPYVIRIQRAEYLYYTPWLCRGVRVRKRPTKSLIIIYGARRQILHNMLMFRLSSRFRPKTPTLRHIHRSARRADRHSKRWFNRYFTAFSVSISPCMQAHCKPRRRRTDRHCPRPCVSLRRRLGRRRLYPYCKHNRPENKWIRDG